MKKPSKSKVSRATKASAASRKSKASAPSAEARHAAVIRLLKSFRANKHTTRGLLGGLHVLGYPFTHRRLYLDPKCGSVERAFEDVGHLLDDAMTLEGSRIGKTTSQAIDARTSERIERQ